VRDDADQDMWVELLRRGVDSQGWKVFAFASMADYYHLFLQRREPNLSAGMQRPNGSFAGYFHARHGTCGQLFRGRFKGVAVESYGHWIELSRYVHLNPVRASWSCTSTRPRRRGQKAGVATGWLARLRRTWFGSRRTRRAVRLRRGWGTGAPAACVRLELRWAF